MRDSNRIPEVIKTIEKLWKQYPDWRFMQLVCNIQKAYGSDMFYVEDNEFVEFINQMVEPEPIQKRRRRR